MTWIMGECTGDIRFLTIVLVAVLFVVWAYRRRKSA